MAIKGAISSVNISCLCVTIWLILNIQHSFIYILESFALWSTNCNGQQFVTQQNSQYCITVTRRYTQVIHYFNLSLILHPSLLVTSSIKSRHCNDTKVSKAYLIYSKTDLSLITYKLICSICCSVCVCVFVWSTLCQVVDLIHHHTCLTVVIGQATTIYKHTTRKFISQWLPASGWSLMLHFTFLSKSE